MNKPVLTMSRRSNHQGFTLVETVIAMGIITIMITAFMAAFGPAVKGIQKSISAKEANRLATTLEYELSILRFEEENSDGAEYTTAFEKAFEWIEESGTNDRDSYILLYQYRGDPDKVRDDGSLEPQADKSKQLPGSDYVLQSVVRRLGDDKVSEELQPGIVEGRVFFVRMTQLVFDNGELKLAGQDGVPGGLGQIIDPTEPRDTVTDHTDYPEATIAFQAQFYVLKSSVYSYVNGTFDLDDDNNDGHPDATGKPAFVRNMAVRR
ncbi:prepilin-type N-terminal cleavage/methylation domain-containing protein [Verrucomicrobiaceae bacterium N1E253]|uniref:Prepilin-type N-terminal cleavage/methylation domain-containing protein n=1 Tax=Oceaniferula marina TaxID=2748318 RepID=A0A851GMD4_9BACT|nr:type II secretion system protein [Oceaniferula marina]NWK57001.1 prepilin-type N-terminal cleavage/methylation domain-containing protein [Oceaniferula marina]